MSEPRHATSGWKDGWYVVPYDVLFRDLDAFGHVNNAVYLTFFEWARTRLWFELTGGVNAHDISFIVARAECDFRAQIAMEPIEILVRISELRTTSFDFVYEIRRTNDGELAATGRVVVVLYDWKTKTKVAIGQDLRRRVREFQRE
ncbi:MAG: thioesterase superfamily protein [Acidobacteria bacterium]|nr:thioesterase superfamily protein [Acidobacteriota bacterium]